MPETKNQPKRIRIINECLSQKGSYWSLQQLKDKLEENDIKVSDRTLKQDLSDMETCSQLQYYAPIEYCRKHRGYHYTNPDYSIDKMPLNRQDVQALEFAASTLQQYQYIPLMHEFSTIINRVIRVVNRVKRNDNKSVLEFIEFERTPTAEGLDYMDEIIEAIQQELALTLTYHSFKDTKASRRVIHPYFIKEYRNRWYVVALDHQKDDIRTFAFDRIAGMEQSNEQYRPNNFFEISEYLRNCIGINTDGKVERVVLSFTPMEGNYVRTQALHRSQVILKDDTDGFIVELHVIINPELISIILSYGNSVKVLEPPLLVDAILATAQRTIDLYHK